MDKLLQNALREARCSRIYSRELFEWVLKTSPIREDTDLISVLVKTDSEKRANNVVAFLQKKGIEARVKYPIQFDPFDKSESEGWGVMVKPGDIKAAAKMLGSFSKGLQFDPFAKTNKSAEPLKGE